MDRTIVPQPMHASITPDEKRYLYGMANNPLKSLTYPLFPPPKTTIMLPMLLKKFDVRHNSGTGLNSVMKGRVAVGRHIPINKRMIPIFLDNDILQVRSEITYNQGL